MQRLADEHGGGGGQQFGTGRVIVKVTPVQVHFKQQVGHGGQGGVQVARLRQHLPLPAPQQPEQQQAGDNHESEPFKKVEAQMEIKAMRRHGNECVGQHDPRCGERRVPQGGAQGRAGFDHIVGHEPSAFRNRWWRSKRTGTLKIGWNGATLPSVSAEIRDTL